MGAMPADVKKTTPKSTRPAVKAKKAASKRTSAAKAAPAKKTAKRAPTATATAKRTKLEEAAKKLGGIAGKIARAVGEKKKAISG